MGLDVPRQPLSVLIVEDCPDTASSLAQLLRYWGHEPSIARNGMLGLTMASASPPDAVLLDVALPDLCGWEVARRLRSASAARRPLIVVMSGYCRDEDREKSRNAGCQAHMAKPLDLDVLERMLGQWSQDAHATTPTELAGLLVDLYSAADLIEAIDNPALQQLRGWNLSNWRYDLVPWGVRFQCRDGQEVVATLDRRAGPKAAPYFVVG